MGFLAPFYLIAGLAIGLPIAFHLIRQTPRGQMPFSSLMFLKPSPPRVTKRSRVEDWWLLLLRALAFLLLAFAFARPFFKSEAKAEATTTGGRKIAILLDTSASMQRDGIQAAVAGHLERTKKGIQPEDQIALYTFDDELVAQLAFEEWGQLDPGSRVATLVRRTEELKPSWNGTELGQAMIQAVEQIGHQDENISQRRLIVISDLQSGSQWEVLNGFTWPENVTVEFLRTSSQSNSNAGLQVVASDDLDEELRVRVSNSIDAEQDLFRVGWQDAFSGQPTIDENDSSTAAAYVPPGQSRVIRAPKPTTGSNSHRLVLSGDDEPFDNVCFVSKREPTLWKVLFLGDEGTTANSLGFFLDPAFPSTPNRIVTVTGWEDSDPTSPPEATPSNAQNISMVIVGQVLPSAQLEWVKTWLHDGGKLTYVVTSADQQSQLRSLLGNDKLTVSEADVEDYSMWTSIDFGHSVLAPFDDPRFSDFSKLRFWKYRQMEFGAIENVSVLAKFDDNSPAFAEIPVGNGRMMILASGWGRGDSDLAVSTKFVPLLNGILEHGSLQSTVRPQFQCGDEIALADFGLDGTIQISPPNEDSFTPWTEETFLFDAPGVYRFRSQPDDDDSDEASSNEVMTMAVNIPPEESETAPLDIEILTNNGIPTTRRTQDAEPIDPDQKRQLVNEELESKQQAWKWLLLGAGVILLLESLLGGLLDRRQVSVEY